MESGGKRVWDSVAAFRIWRKRGEHSRKVGRLMGSIVVIAKRVAEAEHRLSPRTILEFSIALIPLVLIPPQVPL